jgi:hypothetical protein
MVGVGVDPEVVREVAVAQGMMATLEVVVVVAQVMTATLEAEVALAQETMKALEVAAAVAAAAVQETTTTPAPTTNAKKVPPAPASHTTNAAGAPHARRAVNHAAKYGAAKRLTTTPSAGVRALPTHAPSFGLVLAHPPTRRRRPQLKALVEGRGQRRQMGFHRLLLAAVSVVIPVAVPVAVPAAMLGVTAKSV